MPTFNTQYKLLFFLTWVTFYIIFPSWALPISVSARALVFIGLLVYFILSANLLDRWFNALTIDKPVIIKVTNWNDHIKRNKWLIIICFLAVMLHINQMTLPLLIVGDETAHVENGLWIYQHINSKLHIFFQIAFWVITGLLIILLKTKATNNILSNLFNKSGKSTNDSSLNHIYLFFIIGLLITYFYLLRNVPYLPSLVRYPPVSKFLYFLAYSAFGINHILPRILQLFLYLLCATYLYRTINLFHAKETALLGATIYLFLPISFFYSRLGELESGVICLIAINSFYFLRYLKDRDSRDLLLSTYITGFGFLYKDPVFLIFPVCFVILVYHRIKNHLLSSLPLKIVLLAPITVIPWMIITKFFNWRNYTFQMSNLTSLDAKITPYILLIASNLSEIIFILFVLSVFYVCIFQRNVLMVFFALLFSVYLFFIISDMGALSPRFSLALYPTVTVFLSLFISRIINYIRGKHSFKICFLCLTTYLIIICTVPPFNNRFLSIERMKIMYFPSDQALRWVKDNIKDGEQILMIRIQSAGFYQKKYAIEKDKIIDNRYDLGKINTSEKFFSLYSKHDLTYIMFPYSVEYVKHDINSGILEYLKNNSNNEFVEVARFNLNESYIYIYKFIKA